MDLPNDLLTALVAEVVRCGKAIPAFRARCQAAVVSNLDLHRRIALGQFPGEAPARLLALLLQAVSALHVSFHIKAANIIKTKPIISSAHPLDRSRSHLMAAVIIKKNAQENINTAMNTDSPVFILWLRAGSGIGGGGWSVSHRFPK